LAQRLGMSQAKAREMCREGIKKSLLKGMRILFVLLALLCVVSGRIYTYDLTEGQDFIEGLPYWIGALLWGFLSWFPFRNKKKMRHFGESPADPISVDYKWKI